MEFTPNTIFLIIIGIASFCGLLYFLLTGNTGETADGTSTVPVATSGSSTLPSAASAISPSRVQIDEREKSIRDRLVHAGLYKKNSKAWFVFSQIIFAAIPFVVGFVAYGFAIVTLKSAMLISLITAIAGIVAPGLWLDFRKAHRQKTLRRSLPDALDVIVVCVEAGLSLNAAIVRVAGELEGAHPMLASEMSIVHREIQLGKSTGLALKSMALRFDLEELRSLANVIQQSERFGTSVAQALRVHAESLREKRMQQAATRAQQAAVKLLFPTVLCIFPALLVVILGPAVYDIIEMFSRLGL